MCSRKAKKIWAFLRAEKTNVDLPKAVLLMLFVGCLIHASVSQ